jgi:UDP-glucuronate decarboxylase
MVQLAEKVIRMVGSRSKLVFRPLPQDDPRQRRPDITLAQEKLRWRPQVDLEDGLQETIAYFRKTLDLRQPRPQPVSAEQPRTRIETA